MQEGSSESSAQQKAANALGAQSIIELSGVSFTADKLLSHESQGVA